MKNFRETCYLHEYIFCYYVHVHILGNFDTKTKKNLLKRFNIPILKYVLMAILHFRNFMLHNCMVLFTDLYLYGDCSI